METKADLREQVLILQGTIDRREKQVDEEISTARVLEIEIAFLKERLETFDRLISDALGRNMTLAQENKYLIRAEIMGNFRSIVQDESAQDQAILDDLEERKQLEELYHSTGIYY